MDATSVGRPYSIYSLSTRGGPMNNYDFRSLTDKDFEALCADLLGDVEGRRFERFKPGRDAGVDGRYFKDDKEVILQCKHWANTPIEQLIRRLRVDECPKLQKLNPSRYLLAISNHLSRADKNAIVASLLPFVVSPSDVFGNEDLNDLLASRQGIVQRHYKLWLNSSAVLTLMLNKPIFERSMATLEDARDSVKKYVVTSHHQFALKKLEELGVLIITGEPGIGKTTLAEHLCLTYAASGYQLLQISSDIKEAEAAFDKSENQLFFFDDFLGRNYLEALSGHEGSHIVAFIRRVLRAKGKRFILTSRSTILNQGKILIDSFHHQKLDKNEYQLVVSHLTELDKARILYNHIWHSDLPVEFVDQLYADKRYRLVINHRNFNPRLISFITDASRVGEDSAKYWDFVSRQLHNPSEVWDNPFVAQQDDFGRCLVLLVALNRIPISERALLDAYSRFISHPINAGMRGRKDYLSTTRHLTGSLLSRRVDDHMVRFDLFNPSIGDYVLRRYATELTTLKLAFNSLRSVASLDTLERLGAAKIVAVEDQIAIAKDMLSEAIREDFLGQSPDHLAKAALLLKRIGYDFLKINPDAARAVAAYISREEVPLNFKDAASFMKLAFNRKMVSDAVAFNYLTSALKKKPNYDELKVIDSLLYDLTPSESFDTSDVEHTLHDLIVEAIETDLSELVSNGSSLSGIAYNDYDTAEARVVDVVEQEFAEFYMDFDRTTAAEIVAASDYRSWADDQFEAPEEEFDRRVMSAQVFQPPLSPADPIDDLFERS